MTDRCVKHPFEAAVAPCRECGHNYCGECLVYSFGAKKPPFCVACALAAAGVRRGAAVTPVRAQKSRRLFGRKTQVVAAAAAPTFDDIPITFPEGLVPGNEAPVSEIAPEITRRPPPPAYLEPEPALVGAEMGDSLTEWGASLEDTSSSTGSFESLSGYAGSHDEYDSFGGFDGAPQPSQDSGFGSSTGFDSGAGFGSSTGFDSGAGFGSSSGGDSGFSSAAWPETPSDSSWSAPRDTDWSGAAPWPSDDSSGGSSF